jgi:hypothetical protein
MFTQRTALSMNAEVIRAAKVIPALSTNAGVIPAQAGIQFRNCTLGPGLRRGDR